MCTLAGGVAWLKCSFHGATPICIKNKPPFIVKVKVCDLTLVERRLLIKLADTCQVFFVFLRVVLTLKNRGGSVKVHSLIHTLHSDVNIFN